MSTVYDLVAEITASATWLAEHDDVRALQVIARQAERLVVGRRDYGKLDPIGDPRNWLKERRDELHDSQVYTDNQLCRIEEMIEAFDGIARRLYGDTDRPPLPHVPPAPPSWSGEPGPV